ncbi:MAG: dienelactone hydrolase [Promethearchaeota archaeon CR_4]|nr:MAG: dienelactone hydrolase [Candidatus Lokiarchaeota archaeon CR_4]
MKQTTTITVPSTTIQLEAEYYLPETQEITRPAVILCHPHPLYGGDMYNNVVTALFENFRTKGVPVIRFNFRGAGNSTGATTGGLGEIEDVKAVIQAFCNIVDYDCAFVAGYSFGAAIGGVAAAEMRTVIGYAAIAMPFDLFPEHARRMNCEKPKLFVQGMKDNVADFARFKIHAKNLANPLQLREIASADHFFTNESSQAAKYAVDFYLSLEKKSI